MSARIDAASPSPAPPLVGRERERAILRGALDAALGERGALVLASGEAGIGKTALAEGDPRRPRGAGGAATARGPAGEPALGRPGQPRSVALPGAPSIATRSS